jgi:hypothetical protein
VFIIALPFFCIPAPGREGFLKQKTRDWLAIAGFSENLGYQLHVSTHVAKRRGTAVPNPVQPGRALLRRTLHSQRGIHFQRVGVN